ncbi:MAG: FHA domain-containing protein [Anaerolineae bacterium]
MSENPKMPFDGEGATINMNSTTDLRKEAEEALRMFQGTSQDSKSEAEITFENQMTLHIEVNGSTTPIVVSPKDKTTIGRKDPTSGDIPDIDLSTYAAYQMGVSRTHAFIEREQNQLTLHDLNSRNGTFVNGQRIVPEQPKVLHNGDEVRLGKIVMRFSYRKPG